MKILPVILLLCLASCSFFKKNHDISKAAKQADQRVQSRPLLAKPAPLARDYTAPYPKKITAMPTTTIVDTPTKNSSKTSTTLEKRVVEISVRHGALTTEDFLGKKKKSVFDDPEPVTTIVENPESLRNRALNLPPKDVEAGRYHTFRRLEDDMLYDTRKLRSKIAGLIFPEIDNVKDPVPPPPPHKPAYCYKTAGDTTCYSKPIEGQDSRLVGKLD